MLLAVRRFGVTLQCLGRAEIPVAFDAQAAGADDCVELGQAHAPQFGKAHAEIAKAEGDVRVFRIKLGQQPRRSVPWAEQLDDRLKVLGLPVLFGPRGIDSAVLAHTLFL